MSWGIQLLRGNTGGLIIDQNFPGHYLDATSPRYVSAFSHSQLSVGSGQNPYRLGYHLNIPWSDLYMDDVLFYRPAGRNTFLPGNVGHAAFEKIQGNPNQSSPSIRTPCYLLHMKKLSRHPGPSTGWGAAVYTPSGQQAFNSAAWGRRLDVVTSGFTAAGGWTELSPALWGEYLLLAPSDSINNYYCLLVGSQMTYMPTDTNMFPFRGVRYRYDYGLNRIYLEGGPSSVHYFCVARVGY